MTKCGKIKSLIPLGTNDFYTVGNTVLRGSSRNMEVWKISRITWFEDEFTVLVKPANKDEEYVLASSTSSVDGAIKQVNYYLRNSVQKDKAVIKLTVTKQNVRDVALLLKYIGIAY